MGGQFSSWSLHSHKIIVFYGFHIVLKDINDLNDLFDTDPNNVAFKDVFDANELAEINKEIKENKKSIELTISKL